MTPKQIAERVQHEADARFGDTIERLLFILDITPRTPWQQEVINKWRSTGLIDGFDDEMGNALCLKLEEKAMDILAEEHRLGKVYRIESVADRLYDVREKFINEYGRHSSPNKQKSGFLFG